MILPCDSRDSARSHIMSKASVHWAMVRIAWWMRPPPRRRRASTLEPSSGPRGLSEGSGSEVCHILGVVIGRECGVGRNPHVAGGYVVVVPVLGLDLSAGRHAG